MLDRRGGFGFIGFGFRGGLGTGDAAAAAFFLEDRIQGRAWKGIAEEGIG